MKVRWLTSVYMLAMSLALFGWPATAPAQYNLTTAATPTTPLNTGAPVSGATAGESVLPSQWVALQFTVTDPTVITDVKGYIGAFGTSGAVNIVIWTNNNFDPTLPVPGQAIWSQSYTLTAPGSTANWVDFPNYQAVLAPGTYWIAFEGAKGSTVNVGMLGPATTPAANSAFFDGGINTWLNFNFGLNHSTNYPAAWLTGYDLGTASGTPLITSGTFARTVTQGSIQNYACGQNLGPVGNIGQTEALQWNICSGAFNASAYGTIAANPKTFQGNILEAGAYSETNETSSGAGRGIVFSTYMNTTGKDIPNVQANAVLSGSIAGASSDSPVTVAAAVYVFDTVAFTTYINSVVPTTYPTLGYYLLGGNNVVAGVGSYYAPNLGQDLFGGGYVDDSWDNNSQFTVCTSASCLQGYEVSTAGFDLPADAFFTVMFDVTAATRGLAGAQTTAIGDFLSTLEADPQYFFTDGNKSFNNGLGNVITGIAGPLTAAALPDTPATISLSPSSQSTAVGSTTVVTATVTDASNNPVPDAIVRFAITSGPHAGFSMPVGTGDGIATMPNGTVIPLGTASFSYTDTLGTAGTDSISASVGSLSAATPAQVTWTTPGPLFNITLIPSTNSISLNNSQTYDATGTDYFGNSVGDVTSQLTFTLSPDGSCTGAVCTPTATGPHTVTGTGTNPVVGNITGTASLNVTSASSTALTITASNTMMAYGSTPPTPTALYTYGSTTLSSTPPSGLTTLPTCMTSATSTTAVGTDTGANACSGASGSNYAISYVAGNVVVSAEPVTITASNTSMTFGSTAPTPTPEYTYGNVTLSSTAPAGLTAPSCVTSATSTTPVGTDTGANTCSGASGSNYSISYVAGNVTVSGEPVTITASNTSVTYGSTPPIPTAQYTYGTFVLSSTPPNGLTPGTCVTSATSTTPVGTDTGANTCSGASGSNYTFSYVAGSVTVSAASLNITASSPTMTYGGTVPTITATYTYGSVVNSSTPPSGLSGLSCATTATNTSPVGSYPSSCSGAVDTNYTIGYTPGSVKVGQASLSITASSGSMTTGSTPPAITPSYSGFVAGNTAASLTTQPACVTSVTSSTSPGTYTGADTCSGAVDPNYVISYVAGNMVVNPATGSTFKLIATPKSETIHRGILAAFLLEAQSVDGFSGNVKITCSGGPAGSMCGEFPQTVNLQPNKFALALSGALFPKNTTPGTYTLTFTGTSGSDVVSTTAQFKVQD